MKDYCTYCKIKKPGCHPGVEGDEQLSDVISLTDYSEKGNRTKAQIINLSEAFADGWLKGCMDGISMAQDSIKLFSELRPGCGADFLLRHAWLLALDEEFLRWLDRRLVT